MSRDTHVAGICSGSIASDSFGELHVFGHDGHSSGVNGAQVRVLKKSNHVCFTCFLESRNSRSLESQVGLEVTGDLSDESLKGELSDKELSGLLESSDLSKGHGTRSESVGSLNSTTRLGSFVGDGGLAGDMLSRLLISRVFSRSMLGSCHLKKITLKVLIN